MKKRVRLYRESINEFHINGFNIRIWREQKKGYSRSNNTSELWKRVNEIVMGKYFTISNPEGIAEELCKIKGVNAAQCMPVNGTTGSVIYKNWP